MVHIRMSCHLRREEMSKYTKTRIMDAFLYLLNEKSMDRLTVKDVIETAEVNRNTFYYHFEDIYDLLHQVGARI